jgi:hypothetical protein
VISVLINDSRSEVSDADKDYAHFCVSDSEAEEENIPGPLMFSWQCVAVNYFLAKKYLSLIEVHNG